MYRKRVLEVVFAYGLHMIGKIVECRASVVEILLRPIRLFFKNNKIGGGKEDETRRSTPALPKASLSVAISAVSMLDEY